MNLKELKFPIGQFNSPVEYSEETIQKWISDIELFPQRLLSLTSGLSKEQLNWKYRPDGWAIKQVVHHCADSHMNSLIRFKLTLTEDTPNIRPYFEDKWAELSDSVSDDISDSVTLLKGLHAKWTYLLKNLTDKELLLQFSHPEHGTKFSLQENIGVYAWHCNHHLAHIKLGLQAEGKYN